MIKEFKKVLPKKMYNRALYVTKETKRTLKAVKCIEKKDFKGFGGCTIYLIDKSYTDAFITNISTSYQEKFNIKLTPINVAVSNGVSIV